MKNPYIRLTLILSLLFSFLFTLFITLNSYSVLFKSNNQFIIVLSHVQDIFILPMVPIFMVCGLGFVMFFGIALEAIGPILVFISWFVIFYLITYVYSRIIKKTATLDQGKNKKLIILCVVCIFLLFLFSAIQRWSILDVSKRVNQIIDGYPVTLTSISPSIISNGDLITLKGFGLSQQNSTNEIIVWLVDKQNNKYGFLWKGRSVSDTSLTFTMKTTDLCDNAIQNPCKGQLRNFAPGQYMIEIRGGGDNVSLPITIN